MHMAAPTATSQEGELLRNSTVIRGLMQGPGLLAGHQKPAFAAQ